MANNVTLVLKNAKVYDVSKLDIMVGENFALELDTTIASVRWFSDNDPALGIQVSQDTKSISVKALSEGETELWIVDAANGNTAKKLYIKVFSEVAVSLGITPGEVTLK